MNVTEHLLEKLGEECSEVHKETSKANCFGLQDVNYLIPTGPNNESRIVNELNDLMGVVEMLVERDLLPADWQDSKKKAAKKRKVVENMIYAQAQGALQDFDQLEFQKYI